MSSAVAVAPTRLGRLRQGLPLAALLLLVDQASKWWVLHSLDLPARGNQPVLAAGPFGLDLTMVWNRGVTFGLLSGDGPLNHLLLALLAAVVVFLRAHAWGWDWYVFNIADAGIVCGVAVLLADALFRRPAGPKD